MSGHSKWNNIKARKGKSDAERSKIFTKIGREIMVAVKEGGPNVESNSKLKMAIAKARQFNMPNDRINSVIKKNSEVDNSNYVEQTYEGYGVGGKTGTAQKYVDGKIAVGKYVMSFIGFFPYYKPEYMCLVTVDEPIGGNYGSTVSAPLCKEIFQGIISKDV